ncbi:MAG: GNAT family protein [Pseudomonadota bacterium]
MSYTNALGQPVDREVPQWQGCAPPPTTPMVGRFCRVEPLRAQNHARSLWAAMQLDPQGLNWTYSPAEMPADFEGFRAMVTAHEASADPMFHAIVDADSGDTVGWATYMRLDPPMGVIEVGNIHYSPRLQRQPAGTEAMYLMMRRAFDELGYRRYEWKCHAHNAPSRAAALRYGFTPEGVHRQAMVLKGRNRDTAWYSILDSEWPAIKAAFKAWLDPANFDADGQQRQRLSVLMAQHRDG